MVLVSGRMSSNRNDLAANKGCAGKELIKIIEKILARIREVAPAVLDQLGKIHMLLNKYITSCHGVRKNQININVSLSQVMGYTSKVGSNHSSMDEGKLHIFSLEVSLRISGNQNFQIGSSMLNEICNCSDAKERKHVDLIIAVTHFLEE